MIGIKTFDDKANLTQVAYPADGLRTMDLTSFRMGETGTYTVNPNCTGSAEIHLNVTGGFAVDSPLEQAGFELYVPPPHSVPQLGWSWCVWQRATGPTPPSPKPFP